MTGMMERYDAGILNDFGGGNVEWWHDYIRAELGLAHDFYQSQVEGARTEACNQALEEAAQIAFRVSEDGEYFSDADVDTTDGIFRGGAFTVFEDIRELKDARKSLIYGDTFKPENICSTDLRLRTGIASLTAFASWDVTEIERLRNALEQIANGDGVYGAQAFEYKQVARAALADHQRNTSSVVLQKTLEMQHKVAQFLKDRDMALGESSEATDEERAESARLILEIASQKSGEGQDNKERGNVSP